MKTIWKYEIHIVYEQQIVMPKGARILSCQTQHGIPYIWAVVDTEAEKEKRNFFIIGTGNVYFIDTLGVDTKFIGTVQLPNDTVWHIFEKL